MANENTTFKIKEPSTGVLYEVGIPSSQQFGFELQTQYMGYLNAQFTGTQTVHDLVIASGSNNYDHLDNIGIYNEDWGDQMTLFYGDQRTRLLKIRNTGTDIAAIMLNSDQGNRIFLAPEQTKTLLCNQGTISVLTDKDADSNWVQANLLANPVNGKYGAFKFTDLDDNTRYNATVDFIVLDNATNERFDYTARVEVKYNDSATSPELYGIITSPSHRNWDNLSDTLNLQWFIEWGMQATGERAVYFNWKPLKDLTVIYRASMIGPNAIPKLKMLGGMFLNEGLFASRKREYPRFDDVYFDVVSLIEEHMNVGFDSSNCMMKITDPSQVGSAGGWIVQWHTIDGVDWELNVSPGNFDIVRNGVGTRYVDYYQYTDAYDVFTGFKAPNGIIKRIYGVDAMRNDQSGQTLTIWNSQNTGEIIGSTNNLKTQENNSIVSAINEVDQHARHLVDITAVPESVGNETSWRWRLGIPHDVPFINITGSYTMTFKDPQKPFNFGTLVIIPNEISFTKYNEDTGFTISQDLLIDPLTAEVVIYDYAPIPFPRDLEIVSVTGTWDPSWPIRQFELYDVPSLYGMIGDYRSLMSPNNTVIDAVNELIDEVRVRFIDQSGDTQVPVTLYTSNSLDAFIRMQGTSTQPIQITLNNRTPNEPVIVTFSAINMGSNAKRIQFNWLNNSGGSQSFLFPLDGRSIAPFGTLTGKLVINDDGIISYGTETEDVNAFMMLAGAQSITGAKTFTTSATFQGGADFTNGTPAQVIAPSKTTLGTSATQWATEASVSNAISGMGQGVQVIAHQAGLHPNGVTDLDAAIRGDVRTEYFLWHYHSGAWIKTSGTYNAVVDATQYSVTIDYDQPLSFLGKAIAATPTELDQTSVISETHSVAFLYPVPGVGRYTGTAVIDQTTLTIPDADIQTFNNSAKADGSLVYGNGLLFRLDSLTAGVWNVTYVTGSLAPANGPTLGTVVQTGSYNAAGNRTSSGWETVSYTRIRP